MKVKSIIKTKICFKCKQKKSISEFYPYRSGKNIGAFHSYCKECNKTTIRNQWRRIFNHLQARCIYDKNNYYFRKGIKNYLRARDIRFLWLRDKAHLLKNPSIDRINPKENYTLNNCRFIELKENLARRDNSYLIGNQFAKR